MLTHAEFVKELLADAAVKAEYEALVEEFARLDELLRERQECDNKPAAARSPEVDD